MMCSLAASCQLIGRHGRILPRWARGFAGGALALVLPFSAHAGSRYSDACQPRPRFIAAGYAEGAASPISVAREIGARIVRRGEDAVWISRVAEDTLLAAAVALERRATAQG